MEEGRICPIESQLLKVISSSTSKGDLITTLSCLLKIVSNLLSSSSDGRFKVLERNNSSIPNQLLSMGGVHEFLLVIGYHEDQDVYVHGACDENMTILEAASKLLNGYIRQHKNDGFNDPIEFDYQYKENFGENDRLLLPLQHCNFEKIYQKKDKNPSRVKEFLMKHLKKENSEDMASFKHQSRKACSSDFSFNPAGGYFHQSSGKERQTITRKKGQHHEFFDMHDLKPSHGKGSSYLNSLRMKEKYTI